ncbi:class 3 adenylate cyclase [Mycolicibacterium sp. BK556]|uniref:adenylate/guanylate cyclase domain-containing protein n=1 Tax=Mycobacteriaceae TaxID=1762 RepID=UPI00105FCC57|nr:MULTISPECIES: adenylate/guanylate cyclase domain-containing protein [Mycobacteriaceae]MBB3603737.1 class 3 adenylate cyclase [Mycolicibacterium sp. BK556]MBB3633932.1 class 3 adenylate cyclase [Mycolicibacterium sp. BK607]MBB3751514.1 class 3 adenylate cyclase [Mycolicibacterium sp. BK634]TDO12043.1 class 3 adenylate cyclase [Mycobacterium sp. BK086]
MAEVSEQDAAETPRTRLERFRRRRLLSHVSIMSKLILMMVLCSMLAAVVIGGIAFHAGRASIREAVFSRLTEVRESQTRALTGQITDLRNSLIIYTQGGVAGNALEAFTTGFDQLNNAQVSPAQWQSITDYYSNTFVKDVEHYSGTKLDASALLPTTPAERYLQANYTALRKNDDVAITIDDAHDGSQWSAANARYQNFFREIVTRFEFEDALLIDNRGNVVYSAYKDVDLGTNIIDGPYAGSKLHSAYLKAMSANAVDYVGFTDFELYQPAEMQPTAWMVAPLIRNGRAEGVLALQFPITKINSLMTFDQKWQESGMGDTGETVLGGPDDLMRSDSRLFLENPQQYKTDVVNAGTPPDVADMAIRQGGTTLIQKMTSEATVNAQRGETGTVITKDYLGQNTLQAYAPLVIKDSDLHWSIVAKVTTEEAFARESTFTKTMVLVTTGIIFLVCLLAIYLAQIFVRPIRRLEAGAQRISAGDYNVAIPVDTRDEIGDLTAAFNEMGRSLTVKEDLINQQRKENDELLRSLMPDALAERYKQGEETISLEHPNVTVIFADIMGLDRLQAELAPEASLTLINELIRQIDAAADSLGMETVHTVRNGYLASCGLTVPRLDNVRRTVDFALECQQIVERFNSENGTDLRVRAGIDTGAVSSGLLGRPSVVYDMWGAVVNLAHQIKDGSPQPGIYVTSNVHDVLQDSMDFADAGTVSVDGEAQPIWRLSERH